MGRLDSCRALVALAREVHSVYALRLACQLGRLGHLKLDLLHVIENGALPRGAGWAPHTWAREREEEARRELEQLVRAEQEFCDVGGGLDFDHGRPEELLLRRLRSGNYNLVILGTSPSGYPGGVLGHLLRDSPVPVLLTRGVRPLRRVLISTDGTPAAERILRFMGRLLGDSTVETALLSVAGNGNGAAIRRGLELLRAEGVEPRVEPVEAPTWQALLTEASRGDYDLLVAAQEAHGGALREIFTGNPLLQLALHAPCPVLLQGRAA